MRDVTRTHGDIFGDVPKLGPAVMRPLPSTEQSHWPPVEFDVDDDEELYSRYVLSNAQRRLIKTNEGKDRSKRNKKILRKRDQFPERFQELINDVALLYETVYMSSDRWEQGIAEPKETRSGWAEFHRKYRNHEKTNTGEGETDAEEGDEEVSDDEVKGETDDVEGDSFDITAIDQEKVDLEYYQSPFNSPADLWDEITDIKRRGQQVRRDVFFHGKSVVSKEVQFGYEIGSLLQMLKPDDDSGPPGIDLIWGFVLAFIGGSKSGVENEREILNEVINEMNDRHDSRIEDAEQMPDPAEVTQFGEDYDEVTAAAIEEMGLEPHPILVREVRYHQPKLDDEQRHKDAVKSVVSDIADTVPLKEIDGLYTLLVDDIETVENRSVPGIDSARSVIELLQRSKASVDESSKQDENEETGKDDSVSGVDTETQNTESDDQGSKSPSSWVISRKSAAIASDLKIDQSVVQAVINRLSADKNTELWTTIPVLAGKEENGSTHWKLTAYGTLLAHILLRRDKDTSLLHWFALGPEELTLYERQMIIEVLSEHGLISTD